MNIAPLIALVVFACLTGLIEAITGDIKKSAVWSAVCVAAVACAIGLGVLIHKQDVRAQQVTCRAAP